jgi:uncharacterized protein with PQ loop repeat
MNSSNIDADILGWSLTVGAIISYIPQYYKLYKNKECIGLSLINIFLGCMSCYFNAVGYILINKSNFKCDEYDYYCVHQDLPLTQMVNLWICMNVLFSMYFYYAYKKRNRDILTNLQHNTITNYAEVYTRTKKFVFWYFVIMFIHIIITLIFNGSIYNNTFWKYYANGSNIISSIFSICMWIPQIMETHRLKKARSLSLISVGIHSIGCMFTVIYQMYYINQQVWVVLPYLIGGFLEMVIIGICFYNRHSEFDKNGLFISLL